MTAARMLTSQRILADADKAIGAARKEAALFREIRRAEEIVRRFGDRRHRNVGHRPERRKPEWISSNDSSSQS